MSRLALFITQEWPFTSFLDKNVHVWSKFITPDELTGEPFIFREATSYHWVLEEAVQAIKSGGGRAKCTRTGSTRARALSRRISEGRSQRASRTSKPDRPCSKGMPPPRARCSSTMPN